MLFNVLVFKRIGVVAKVKLLLNNVLFFAAIRDSTADFTSTLAENVLIRARLANLVGTLATIRIEDEIALLIPRYRTVFPTTVTVALRTADFLFATVFV